MAEEIRLKALDTSTDQVLYTGNKQTQRKDKVFNGRAREKPGTCYKCDKPGNWKPECCSKHWSYKSQKETGYRGKQANHNDEKDEKLEKAEKGEALIGVQEAAMTAQEWSNEPWFMDSGATAHMTSKRSWFESYEEYSTPVKFKMGDGNHLKAYGQGDILIWAFNVLE